MTAFATRDYSEYEAFAQDMQAHGFDESTIRHTWALLARLDDDEVLVRIPEWLAEQKVGFREGGTPTEFVGRIERETEKAILFADSAAARPLVRLAHRMQSLEDGLADLDETDDDRRQWLRDRLAERRSEFDARGEPPALSEEWLPKSQIEFAVRRTTDRDATA